MHSLLAQVRTGRAQAAHGRARAAASWAGLAMSWPSPPAMSQRPAHLAPSAQPPVTIQLICIAIQLASSQPCNLSHETKFVSSHTAFPSQLPAIQSSPCNSISALQYKFQPSSLFSAIQFCVLQYIASTASPSHIRIQCLSCNTIGQ